MQTNTLEKDSKLINFVAHRKIAFTISLILVVLSIYSVSTKGLNLGVDFTGGIVMEVRSGENINIGDLRKHLDAETKKLGVNEVTLQNIGDDKNIMIRVSNPENKSSESRTKLIADVKALIVADIKDAEFRKVDFVGPQIGEELITNGLKALILAFTGMMLYIWIRFEWQFGVGAILALIHDVILTFGIYSFFGLEFNVTSIAAILTIIGYSINDSVVIYDRIRENLRKFKKKSIDDILDISINSTLSRTILTAGTTLIALLALIIAGGQAILGLSIAVFCGVIIGTYSSIYIASPVLKLIKLKR
jgi:preprotein translocase SecF subunit